MTTRTGRRDARHRDRLPGRQGARRRRLPAAPRRGARPDGRERRRQVDPDQGADRRVRASTPARSGCAGGAGRSPGRPRPRQAGIARSTRRSTSAPTSSVAENILLGREPRRLGPHRLARACARRAAELLAPAQPGPSTRTRCSASHSLAVQQLVAIARAVDVDAAVLILDEPTSSLDADEVRELFRVIRDLRDAGRRDPVRLALPRPGLRDRRPHDGAAQRQAGRRVPDRRAAAARAGGEDDRPGAGRARASSTAQPPTDVAELPDAPVLAATGLGRTGRDRAGRPRRAPRRGRRAGRAARLRAHRAGPAAVRRRPRRLRHRRRRRPAGAGCAARSPPSPRGSRSARRTARPRAWSAT